MPPLAVSRVGRRRGDCQAIDCDSDIEPASDLALIHSDHAAGLRTKPEFGCALGELLSIDTKRWEALTWAGSQSRAGIN